MTNAIFTPPHVTNEPVLEYKAGSTERKQIKATLKEFEDNRTDIPLVIGGEHVQRKETFQVVCPHQHELVLAQCSKANAEDVQNAIAKAVEAQKTWGAMPWEERASVFLRAAEMLATKYRARLNAATMLGQSKTVHQAEIDAACELIDFFRFNVSFMAKLYQDVQPQSMKGMWNRAELRGLEGFVFAVTPFNFTSIAVNLPCAPALMGCGVVWKPAATSMLSSWTAMQILEEAGLPKGVINLISGNPAEISDIVLKHPDLAGIHFTGSTQTFNSLWKEVGANVANYRNYPRLVGETGGKDFIFAHESATPEELLTALIRGSFEYQGQKCSAASRAFIPKPLWKKIKPSLVSQVNEIKMGNPNDFTNFMSAVIDKKSFGKITGYINDAKKSPHCEIIAGGQFDDSVGYYIRPTIIETEDPKYKTMCEEIFGPVLTVFPYEPGTFEATLKICDQASPYALTGAIFANDRWAVHNMTEKLRYAAGNFYINDKPTGAVVGQQPFGGARASGTNDKAGSVLNLIRWTSMRTIKENFSSFTDYRYSFMQDS
ncbi:MAG: L-glutamate gamma-semialdehyde dehydrogenase [Oligoflexales bacterium]